MSGLTASPAPAGTPRPLRSIEGQGLGLFTRAGILVSALGAIVAAFAPTGDLVEGESVFGFGTRVVEASIAITVFALVGLVLLGAAAALPWSWAHYAGIGIGAGWASFFLFFVFVAREDDNFAPGANLTLKSGAIILIVAAVIGMAGVVLALVGTRSGPVPNPAMFADAEGRTSGKAVTALVLGVVSFLVGTVTAALAIAFATRFALDLRASDNRLGGRGLAIGGLVCGIVFLVLWFLGFLAFALFVEPSTN